MSRLSVWLLRLGTTIKRIWQTIGSRTAWAPSLPGSTLRSTRSATPNLFLASPRRYDGLHELTYLFHDRDVSSPAAAAACATGGSTPPPHWPAKRSPSG